MLPTHRHPNTLPMAGAQDALDLASHREGWARHVGAGRIGGGSALTAQQCAALDRNAAVLAGRLPPFRP